MYFRQELPQSSFAPDDLLMPQEILAGRTKVSRVSEGGSTVSMGEKLEYTSPAVTP